MKTISAELAYFLRGRARQNLKLLLYYCGFLLLLILCYATLFRYLMLHLEGREFSFVAGVYWAITVMTTLGFGDITFHTDIGYVFATVVTISGVVFLLIILPFGLISLFLAPWIEQRLRYRPSFSLPPETSGHVLVFGVNPTARVLFRNLASRKIPFVVITDDYEESLRLEEEEDVRVVCGSPTDVKMLQKVRVDSARYIFANLSDTENTNLCLTIRSLCKTPIAAVVDEPEHIDLVRLSGADKAVPLQRIIGRYLGIRSTTCGALAHVIDSFGPLQIAEVPVHGSPFVDMTLEQARIRQQTGMTVIGIWDRGTFTVPERDTLLSPSSLVVLAGTHDQLRVMEELIGEQETDDLVFILGHGRIGCAAARFLDRKPVPYVLIDQEENPHCESHIAVLGDATNRHLLKKAGIDQAKGLIVTTNDDSTNIFLTLSSRNSNPHMRIVARANTEENVAQLYAAGADFVVSNASVGASILMNILESKESIFLTEGVTIFRRPVPTSVVGMSVNESRLRPRTGCSIVALEVEGEEPLAPSPETILRAGCSLVLIGSPEQEKKFGELFGPGGEGW
ncbi:Trk K+ transport system, NAD-binding component [Malonomonas rubra DSM 5091]|uniref:Trk K+ transport system, NAD-binding component n=1 Tax=Malonomonas rubra DSM 5091 TaxID=1122189 RepID=A0A1M6KIF5_MALRU|nr:NAD-binding protein [Malonomonas rubra]SHJ58748.1 Trk K+ transport system, NAD-binding component [Malonomonas rubra DSM 5091]